VATRNALEWTFPPNEWVGVVGLLLIISTAVSMTDRAWTLILTWR
jgi:hypothetical protein